MSKHDLKHMAVKVGLFCALLLPVETFAVPVLDESSFAAPVVIDFEDFTTSGSHLGATPIGQSLTVGNATFSTTDELGILDLSRYAADGTEVDGQALSWGRNWEELVIDFTDPVSSVGFGIFDANNPYFARVPTNEFNIISLYDTAGGLLEDFIITEEMSWFSGGERATFLGFQRAVAEIASVVITPSTLDFLAIDNIRYLAGGDDPREVPEPGTILLLGCGALAAMRKKSGLS